MKYNYVLGLDVGISSVGWGLLALDENNNPYKIIDVGSRIFPPGEVEKTGDSRAKERREKRGIRRVTRRREFRLDRVRNLLFEEGYLKENVTKNKVSEKNEELTIIYNDMINSYYKNKDTNPYKLKVEALDRKLTNDELCIILVHYAKKRGYKSNREESADKENGKVLSAIKENEEIIKTNHYRSISEMYIKDEKFKDKIKNSAGNYKISVTNEMYLDEINKVLDKQINFGLITNEFKQKYLEIYNSRRHYSEGPGYYYTYDESGNRVTNRSKYGGNLIEKMIGKCAFDKNPRAPKYAPSSELFVAISKLVNLRYKQEDEQYTKLSSDEIKSIITEAKQKNKITYKTLIKILNKENIKIKDLSLSKKEYAKVIEDLKNELKISKDEKVDIYSLEDSKKEIYEKIYNDKLYSKTLIELKGYHALRKVITDCYDKNIWNEVSNNIEFLDELALYCTNYKLNDEILKNIKESPIIDEKFEDYNFVEKLPNFKDHLMLSTEIIRKIIPIMEEGNTYDKAMTQIGYEHSNLYGKIEKKDLLVPVCVDKNITNQRVIRSLTQTRKVINAIIKKYGTPKIINIETARELAKSRRERNEIAKNQEQKQAENEQDKKHLVELGFFSDINKISSNDLLKYRLWKEQKEFCGYSMEKIKIEDLFRNNIVQIDHILPYSRTYNDNYLNKTLVYTKYNQDKGNKTPYEWFGKTPKWEEYESYINNLSISQKKKDNYLLKKLDFETEREMREQNLNDTKYISRELATLLKSHLNVEEVNTYPGAITSKLRARWGFNRLIHSYISKTYIMPESMKKDINKDRDNHLHHAMDALVIASITKSLQQKITLYEKFSRYIDGKLKEKISDITINDEKITYDNKTGEVISTNYKEYLKEQLSKNNIYYNKHNIGKLKFPLPYENFVQEAKARVYEQDINTLRYELQNLRTYTTKELKNVHILTPSLAKTKATGAMHKETYYGIYEEKDKDETIRTWKTLRTPIEKVKRKDLENIQGKEGGSKDIYNALIEWFGKDEIGETALKRHEGKYPINPNDKEQKEIKKVKIYTEYKNTGHMIKKANVEKGGIYRIEIYKSKDEKDNKLYFAAYDMYEIKTIERIKKAKKENKPVPALRVKVDYGQGKNTMIIPYEELTTNYKLYKVLNKSDLIKVILKNGKESMGYVVGFTSGKLEIKSIIGDGYDLIGENNIFNKQQPQYQITVSTIKEIEKLSINILGEISGL